MGGITGRHKGFIGYGIVTQFSREGLRPKFNGW
jgi:hypothetical protein